jgi:hypothetical protein
VTSPVPSRRLDLARWRAVLADVSGRGFDDVAAARIQLEGSVLASPIVGIDMVWRTLLVLESLHQEVHYVEELLGESSVHLAWEGRALGVTAKGTTTLGLDGQGRVSRVILHHRPFGAVLLLSTSLSDRLPSTSNGNSHN